VIVAQDAALKVGRQESDLSDLERDGERYLWQDWDLCSASTPDDPCVDGLRSIFVQYRDDFGHASPVYSLLFTLDTDDPSIFEWSLPRFERNLAETLLTFSFHADEPLGMDPVASWQERLAFPPGAISQRPPTGQLSVVFQPGNVQDYDVRYVTTGNEEEGVLFGMYVDVTDRAGNQFRRPVPNNISFDWTAPALADGTVEITPPRAAAGQLVTIEFGVTEWCELPTVLIGGVKAEPCEASSGNLHFVCSHEVGQDEPDGIQVIVAELFDAAGNRSLVTAGEVVYGN
jgi:hypothetical protein